MSLAHERVGDLLTIEPVWCGPPDSGHGGVSVGRFATLVDGDGAEVRLLRPPPLDTALSTRVDGDEVVVVGPDGDVARVRALGEPLDVAPFTLVGEEEVEAAAASYLASVGPTHAFPTCVGCGPARNDPDALRQFTGTASDGDSVSAFEVPGSGPLPSWLVVAGLDCPSGTTVLSQGGDDPTVAVLGTMAFEVRATVEAGVRYQVRGRVVSIDGRKRTSEVAMLDPTGDAVAVARAVWVVVDPSTFGGPAS